MTATFSTFGEVVAYVEAISASKVLEFVKQQRAAVADGRVSADVAEGAIAFVIDEALAELPRIRQRLEATLQQR